MKGLLFSLLLLLTGGVLLAGCSSASPHLSPDPSRCLRVYSEVVCRYHWHSWNGRWPMPAIVKDEDRAATERRGGAAFIAVASGRRYVVTAAHNLGPTWEESDSFVKSLDPKSTITLTGVGARIHVSSLAYPPQRLYVNMAADVAILEMPAEFWEKVSFVAFDAGAALPLVEQVVKAWGFPSTSAPQLAEGLRVTMATAEMLVLNAPLDPGFSGGPVVASGSDKLVGMVARSTDRQSRALPSGKIMQALAEFDGKVIGYGDPLEIHR